MDMAILSAEIVVVVARLNAMNAMAMESFVVTGAMDLEEMGNAFIVQVQDMMIMDLVVFFVMAQGKTNVLHVMGEVIKYVTNVMEVAK